jgi:hypothetical protein
MTQNDFLFFNKSSTKKIIFLSKMLNFQVYFNIFLSLSLLLTLAIFKITSHTPEVCGLNTHTCFPSYTYTRSHRDESKNKLFAREKKAYKNNEKSYDRENELEMRTFERFSLNVKIVFCKIREFLLSLNVVIR